MACPYATGLGAA